MLRQNQDLAERSDIGTARNESKGEKSASLEPAEKVFGILQRLLAQEKQAVLWSACCLGPTLACS